MSGKLAGKVAFITGAARGQGRAHAVQLASEGADIIAMDLCAPIDGVEYPLSDPDDLKQTADLVEAIDRRIVFGVGDVRDRDFMSSIIEDGAARLGRIDFVIANAGVMPIFGPRSNEMRAWQLSLDILLTGVMNTVELSYPHVVANGDGGSIVITSSIAALQPMMRTEKAHTLGQLGYSAAKAGLISLAQNYASLLAEHRIRVNTVHPTAVNTLMIDNLMISRYWEEAAPADLQTLVNAMPVEKVEPEDIANAVLWLCSDDSRYFTGNQVRIDAGASLR